MTEENKSNTGISFPPMAETRGFASAKEAWVAYIHDLQNRICAGLEEADGKAKFIEDRWERPEGGGGKTRVIANGNVFEKGGVNTSVVFGDVTPAMRTQLKIDGDRWWACGLSLVLHPVNPFVPTVHCNYRMFELYNDGPRSEAQPSPSPAMQERGLGGEVTDRWFGGGTDLTPYYLFDEDARHFHGTYKTVCDRFDESLYPRFKQECDNYFVNFHRNNERRGIGGIFYDYQRDSYWQKSLQSGPCSGAQIPSPWGREEGAGWAAFGQACGNAFLDAYLPIVEKRKNTTFNEANKHWQEIRRGRYVEFNLVHDRGTLFGLKTNGRTESILMSLPPTVRFEYDYKPAPGSEEDRLWQACLHPRDWV